MSKCRLSFVLPLLLLQSCLTVFSLPEAPALNGIARIEDQRFEIDEITPFLIHSSPLVRHRAALALARLRDPGAIPVIINRLEIEVDLRVTEMLLFALGQIGDRTALPVLQVFLTHSTESIRAAAMEAAGKLKDPGVTGAVVARLKEDESPRVREEACTTLFRLGTRREKLSDGLPAETLQERTAALTKALLSDTSADVRWKAAYALAEIQDPAAAGALIKAMEDPNVWVRAFGARGLGFMTPSREIQDTLMRSCGDSDWPVAVESIKSLKSYNNLLAAIKLIHLLSPGVSLNTHVRASAARTLGYISNGGESAVKALKQATYDFSLAVEGEAVVALGAIGALSEDFSFLERILQHSNPYLRLKAAEAATFMKDEGVDFLLQLAKDESIRVRCKALEELKGFPQFKDEIVPLAEQALRLDDMALHYTAANLLLAFEARESLPLVMEAYLMSLNEPETAEVRLKLVETVFALEESDDEGLKLVETVFALEESDDEEFLWRCFEDDDFKIRSQAADRLSAVPGQIAIADPETYVPTVIPDAGSDYLNDRPNPRAHIITEKGEFKIELFADMAPYHVKSFIQLAERGVYNRLKFHRVVPNFVIQGLDPRGDGWGHGGTVLRDEINQVKFLRGYVGMPNSGPDTGGCQIFITHCPTPHLDGKYTVFGKVIHSMNIVDALQIGDRVLKEIIKK